MDAGDGRDGAGDREPALLARITENDRPLGGLTGRDAEIPLSYVTVYPVTTISE
jgi:hypothetical protein